MNHLSLIVAIFDMTKIKEQQKKTWHSDNSFSSCLLSSRLLLLFITIRCYFILTVSLTTWKSDENNSNFRLEWSSELRAPSDTCSSPSISSATFASNLVRKLFCVCLWTMQSQVRLIQKETQHKRRSYACSYCWYSVAIALVYFPVSPLPFQKILLAHTK